MATHSSILAWEIPQKSHEVAENRTQPSMLAQFESPLFLFYRLA